MHKGQNTTVVMRCISLNISKYKHNILHRKKTHFAIGLVASSLLLLPEICKEDTAFSAITRPLLAAQ